MYRNKTKTITIRLSEDDLIKLKAYREHLEEVSPFYRYKVSLSAAVREAIKLTESLNLDKSIPTS